MCKYINETPTGRVLPSNGKAYVLAADVPGAEIIKEPDQWSEDLVCVVSNMAWDAALFVEDANEFSRVMRGIKEGDNRPKVWMKIPGAKLLAK